MDSDVESLFGLSPDAVAAILAISALLGAGSILYLVRRSREVIQHFGEATPKIFAEVMQAVSLAGAVGATFSVNKSPWFKAVCFGYIAVAMWKCFQISWDISVRRYDRVAKGSLEAAEKEISEKQSLLSIFKTSTADKMKRLYDALSNTQKTTLKILHDSLTPNPHLERLLRAIGLHFQSQLHDGRDSPANFRVGVYFNHDGLLKVIHAVSLEEEGPHTFTSFTKYPDFFKMDGEGERRSLVVRCIRNKQLIIVSDCVAAAEKGDFVFLHPDQKNYLKSFLAFYLGEVPDKMGNMGHAAVVIDTDQAGFFKAEFEKSYKRCLQHFGVRLKLELALLAVLKRPQPKKRGSDGNGESTSEGYQIEDTNLAESASKKNQEGAADRSKATPLEDQDRQQGQQDPNPPIV